MSAFSKAKPQVSSGYIWEFAKIGGTSLGVSIIRTVVFGGLYWGPLFGETTICRRGFTCYMDLISVFNGPCGYACLRPARVSSFASERGMSIVPSGIRVVMEPRKVSWESWL